MDEGVITQGVADWTVDRSAEILLAAVLALQTIQHGANLQKSSSRYQRGNCSNSSFKFSLFPIMKNIGYAQPKLLPNCSEIALKLLWNCSETALKLLYKCSKIVLKLLWNCSETALKLIKLTQWTIVNESHISMVSILMVGELMYWLEVIWVSDRV